MNPIVKYSNKIKDLCVVYLESFNDFRGQNFEGFNFNIYKKLFNKIDEFNKLNFVVDSYSISYKNVLRGFHGDMLTWKLIDCILGNIQFVVIDLRVNSPTFKSYEMFFLNDKNKMQILVPNGCVNAHLCLSDECIFHYKMTHEYVTQINQIKVKWNDPFYNIPWEVISPILSQRDSI